MRRGCCSILITAFLDLPQHVSASHYQGVVVTSEATQAVCILDVYGLRPAQSGYLSRDVTKHVQWVRFLTHRRNPTHCTRLVTSLDN
jgi:hypothetical protein